MVANELSGEPKEGLLEVVVGLGGDIVVLKILLAVEGNGLGFHFAFLNIDLVAAEDDRNVFADTGKVTCITGQSLYMTGMCSRCTHGARMGRSCR